MLTTVAALIILMGLAVSLAREVRRRSADGVTRELLAELDAAMARYQDFRQRQAPGDPSLPVVAPFSPATPTTGVDPNQPDPAVEMMKERTLMLAARANNQQFVAALRRAGELGDDLFGRLPTAMYDDTSIRDPWGNPLVFMPGMHPAVGMSSDTRPWFFFSAGPDGRYLTREDNVYSYEGR